MSYWDTFYYYLGYEEDIEPTEKSKNIRHECMKQIKLSNLSLKCVEVNDKTKSMINNKEVLDVFKKEEIIIIEEKKEKKKEKKEIEKIENDIKKEIDINEKKRKIQEKLIKRKKQNTNP